MRIRLPDHLKDDPLVNAVATVADYIGRFEVAAWLEGACKGNPNIGKPGIGRFDMANLAAESALEDRAFTGAMDVLVAHSSDPTINGILGRVYSLVPKVQEHYQKP